MSSSDSDGGLSPDDLKNLLKKCQGNDLKRQTILNLASTILTVEEYDTFIKEVSVPVVDIQDVAVSPVRITETQADNLSDNESAISRRRGPNNKDRHSSMRHKLSSKSSMSTKTKNLSLHKTRKSSESAVDLVYNTDSDEDHGFEDVPRRYSDSFRRRGSVSSEVIFPAPNNKKYSLQDEAAKPRFNFLASRKVKKSSSMAKLKRESSKASIKYDGESLNGTLDGEERQSFTDIEYNDYSKTIKESAALHCMEIFTKNKCIPVSRGSLPKKSSRMNLKEAKSPYQLFGTGLLSLLRMEMAMRNLADLPETPIFLKKFLAFIEDEGLEEEGIYRKAGSQSRMKLLCTLCDEKIGNINLYDPDLKVSAYDAANVVKQYFRDLPEPILTFKYSNWFTEVPKLATFEEKVSALRLLFVMLPKGNVKTVEMLLKHLHLVQCHQAKNRMDAQNLAVLVGPNLLFQHLGKDKLLEDDHRDLVIEVVEFMLTNIDMVFEYPKNYDLNTGIRRRGLRQRLINDEEHTDSSQTSQTSLHSDDSNASLSISRRNTQESIVEEEEELEDTVKIMPGERAVVKLRVIDGDEYHKSQLITNTMSVSDLISKCTKGQEGFSLYKGKSLELIDPNAELFILLFEDPKIQLSVRKTI